jgi:hypothetical protein
MADRLVSISCAVDCPHCDEETDVEFDSLAGTGTIPRTYVWCEACGLQFNIESSIDIGIASGSRA